MNDSAFKERYKNLNAEQKLAVDTIDGPVLVVAGPGTGKTEILTLRIANILQKTDTKPENILALTFTDAATANMRRRLSQLVGSVAYRVVIETFHSFCNNVIKDYPEYFPNIIGSAHLTEVESLAILETLVETVSLQLLRPWGDPLYYLRDMNKKIEELKREGVIAEKFVEIASAEERKFKARDDLVHEKGLYKGKMKAEAKKLQKTIAKNLELSVVYAAYQKVLAEKRLYDWSDMIMEVLHALDTSSDLKLSLQENHQYLLVDEHQDTNNAQNRIVELLSDFHDNPNIFVVGDEKQAIFRFQGASAANFLYFKKLYPKAKIIELSQNYRSRQSILDAAHSLAAGSSVLTSQFKEKSRPGISIAEFAEKSHELSFVAEQIKHLIEKEKIDPREIAVLYRSNREAFAVAEALERVQVTYGIESDEDLLSEKFVRKLLIIFEAISHYGEEEYLTPLFHVGEFEIDPLEAYRFVVNAKKEKTNLYDAFPKTGGTFAELAEKLTSWVKFSKTDGLSEFLERILRESGILSAMIASKDAGAFLGIERLFAEGKRIAENRSGARFADFMEYIGILREHKLFIKRPKHKILPGAVRLMTAHGSKGLEFEYVFIVNATERSFGEKSDRDALPLLPSVYSKAGLQNLTETESLADERRLFYVCLTRAKKSVCITYSTYDENGKEVLPSPFILEIRDDTKEKINTEAFEKKLKEHPESLFAVRVPALVQEIDREFVSELFHAHPLSVSALNNYLSCPWKYFYRNLLRIPSAQEKYQIYGTAMHAAVEDLWRVLKEREVSEKFLLDSYKRELGLLGVLSQKEFAEALLRGETALRGWFLWASPKLTHPIIPEFSIRGVELNKEILLSGNLDKMEMVGTKRTVVTDYKTGKQHSRNDILGNTKSSTGDMIRQLQFYKLLLKLHDNIEMERGIIEFLEPNENGNYNREEFDITDVDVEEIKKTIIRVADEITSLAFWNTTCDNKTCEYCGYRRLLQ